MQYLVNAEQIGTKCFVFIDFQLILFLFLFLWQNDWIHTEGKFWYFVNLSSLGLSENAKNVLIASGTTFYVSQNRFQVHVMLFWDLKLFILFQPCSRKDFLAHCSRYGTSQDRTWQGCHEEARNIWRCTTSLWQKEEDGHSLCIEGPSIETRSQSKKVFLFSILYKNETALVLITRNSDRHHA